MLRDLLRFRVRAGGMAFNARRLLCAGGKRMTREACVRGEMGLLVLFFVAAPARRRLRLLREPVGMAFGAGELLASDVRGVHRRAPRLGPRHRYVLRRCHRRLARSQREIDGDAESEHTEHRDGDHATNVHGA